MTRSRVAIVGGGPAGLSAALAVASTGAETIVIDEQPGLGGRLRYQRAPVATTDGTIVDPANLTRHLIAAAGEAGVLLWPGMTAWALFAGNRLALFGAGAPAELDVDRVILATGSTDRPYPFPGGSLPGVFSARAVQLLLNHYRVRPGRRFVILGNGSPPAEIAADIAAAGGETVAIVPIGEPGVPLLAKGDSGVDRVLIDGEPVEADIVVVAVGRQPDADLARLAGAEMSWRAEVDSYLVVHGAGGETTVPGLFVTGDAAGVTDMATALARGRATGLGAAASLGLIDADDAGLAAARAATSTEHDVDGAASDHRSTISSPVSAMSAQWGTSVERGAAEFLCRCEEVSTAVILDAIEAGARSINDVKRRTRAGMGVCQGCFCTGPIAALLHHRGAIPRSGIDPMTARPPVRLLPLERLSGQ